MLISSCASAAADAADAAAATDCCTNWPAVGATVVFVAFAFVACAMTLPCPDQTRSPSVLALDSRRGKTMSRSPGDGRYELALLAAGASIGMCGHPRAQVVW